MKVLPRLLAALLGTVSLLVGTQCSPGTGESDGKPVVLVTTTMAADLLKQIGADAFHVEALMGPGVDPHLFTPRSQDVQKLREADAIVYSGFHLEGKMAETFERYAKTGKKVCAIADGLPKDSIIYAGAQTPDPHIWGDATLWAAGTEHVSLMLQELAPEHAAEIKKATEDYVKRLLALHEDLKKLVQTLPESKRVLVTSHDAFRYFGRAYGLEVVSVMGISTDSEASVGDIKRVVDKVREHNVKAIFIESSVPKATIERVSKDSGAVVGPELLSDALSSPGDMEVVNGTPADRGTVEGMLRSNLHRIITALK